MVRLLAENHEVMHAHPILVVLGDKGLCPMIGKVFHGDRSVGVGM